VQHPNQFKEFYNFHALLLLLLLLLRIIAYIDDVAITSRSKNTMKDAFSNIEKVTVSALW
jgi:hypothetical protein